MYVNILSKRLDYINIHLFYDVNGEIDELSAEFWN